MVTEPILCPPGYENLDLSIGYGSVGGSDPKTFIDFECRGEKGMIIASNITYGFIMGGLYMVYAFGGILLNFAVHVLLAGSLSFILRRFLSLILFPVMFAVAYFLPGWIAPWAGPLIW